MIRKRIAVIGSGPSGFYATLRLLQDPRPLTVDLFEKLPVPFGLSRYGVAPDHPEVKNCEHKFEEIARNPNFRFFGNVKIGQKPSFRQAGNILFDALKPHYDAILLSYGAAQERGLNIPGENLTNVLSARKFVNWYNGHPFSPTLFPSPGKPMDLSKIDTVDIVGQGNVALDVARMLLQPVDSLKEFDVPDHVLAELSRNSVRHVSVVGRRGPLQLAATTKELREMLDLPDVAFHVDQKLLEYSNDNLANFPKMEGLRARKRMMGFLVKGSKNPPNSRKSWSLDFLQSPVEIFSNADGNASSIKYEINRLVGSDPINTRAEGTNTFKTRDTDMIFTSVGYKSVGLEGIPFDEKRGVVPNELGRVKNLNGDLTPHIYTSGWLSNGPNGTIATTMFDAFSTAETILEDLFDKDEPDSEPKDRVDVSTLTSEKVVSWREWEKIDALEKQRGREKGKIRDKITTIPEILAVLD